MRKKSDESIEQFLIRRLKSFKKKINSSRCTIAETNDLWGRIAELEDILKCLNIEY